MGVFSKILGEALEKGFMNRTVGKTVSKEATKVGEEVISKSLKDPLVEQGKQVLVGENLGGTLVTDIVKQGPQYQIKYDNGQMFPMSEKQFSNYINNYKPVGPYDLFNRNEIPKAPTVEDIFEKGVDNFTKEELTNAIAKAKYPVTRIDRYAPQLMKEGFKEGMSPPLGDSGLESRLLQFAEPEELHQMVRTGKFSPEVQAGIDDWKKWSKNPDIFDEPGLYWGKGKGVDTSGVPAYQSTSQDHLIEGAINPKVSQEDIYARDYMGEFVQKEPNQVLAKYKDLFKIIGLTGATTLGSQLIPDNEAEAGPLKGILGKFTEGAVKKATGQSSAADRLIGKVWDGKVIKDVVKGSGTWRYVMFEDGTKQAVNGSDNMRSLVRELRTQEYVDRFKNTENESSKLMQAYKSLQHHTARQQPLVNKEAKEAWREKYSKIMKEGTEEVPWTYVESHDVYLPSEYAKILEEHNVVKIKKEK